MKRKVEQSPERLRQSVESASRGDIEIDLPKQVLRLVSTGKGTEGAGPLTTLAVTPKICTNDHLVHPPGRTVMLTIRVIAITPSPMMINVRRPIR